MEPKAKVRKATINDIAAICTLGKKVHELEFSKEYPFHEKAEIREYISHPKDNIVLVAEKEGLVVGFLNAKILSHASGGWCMIDNLAIESHKRHKGIGTELLDVLYKDIKKRKIWYVQILEEVHHKKTRKFWKSKGYKVTKTFLWAEKAIR